MCVARHKTTWEDPASITLTREDYYFLERCVQYVHPLCNPAADELFVSPKGDPITDLKKYIVDWRKVQYSHADLYRVVESRRH